MLPAANWTVSPLATPVMEEVSAPCRYRSGVPAVSQISMDGTVVQPLRTPGGYRRFTLAMLEDIALSSYRNHWFSMDNLKSIYRELLVAAHRETGEYKIPS